MSLDPVPSPRPAASEVWLQRAIVAVLIVVVLGSGLAAVVLSASGVTVPCQVQLMGGTALGALVALAQAPRPFRPPAATGTSGEGNLYPR